MKKFLIMAVTAIAVLNGCSSENDILPPDNDTTYPLEGVTKPTPFTATMEDSPKSRATLNGMTPNWEAGDQICINGAIYKGESAGLTSIFNPIGEEKEATAEIRPTYVSSNAPGSKADWYASNLVDEAGTSTRWVVQQSEKVDGVWNIVVSTGVAVKLHTIKLWNADNQTYPGRRWKDIKVYGSSSPNGSWEEIKTLDNLNLAKNKNGLAGELPINSAKEYAYYKIDIVNNEGDTYIQMSDMKFVVTLKEIRPSFVSSKNTQCYGNNPASNLVDEGGTDTRWVAQTNHKVDGVWNIVVSTGVAVKLQAIRLWNADNQTYPGRRWKDIKVYGSSSPNGSWEEIKTLDNLNLAKNKNGLAGELPINSAKEYTFYQIDVSGNEGDDYMQMSDMKFLVSSAGEDGPYAAYFPSTLYTGNATVLPSAINETYVEGKFNMPMYAQSHDHYLHFKNLCGVLRISVNSDRIAAVKSIKVSSANKAVSGAFTVKNDAASLISPSVIANTLTVTYENAVSTTEEGKVFYVAIPAQTYQQLKIELSADGTNYTTSMTTKSGKDIVVERSMIYPLDFNRPYVEIEADYDLDPLTPATKLKWATYNVGANSVDEYGDYYAWSETEPRYTSYTRNGFNISIKGWKPNHSTGYSQEDMPTYTEETLDAAHDAATVNWGEKWRMPTQKEFEALIDATTWTWDNTDKGYYLTKKDETLNIDKSNALLFFPAAGVILSTKFSYGGDQGCYWTSTIRPVFNDDAYYLKTQDPAPGTTNKCSVLPNKKRCGYTIRAVSDY